MRWLKRRFERLSPGATWWVTFVGVFGALLLADAGAIWLFSWNRPWWLSFLAGAAYGLFASVAASHHESIAEARAADPAPKEMP